MHGDGRQTRDFTSVESVVDVIAQALERRVTSPEPVNLAFGTRTDLLTLIRLIQEVLGEPVAVRHEDLRPGDVRDSQADSTRLRELFPDVAPVPLAEALDATLDWFRAQRTAVPRRR